MQYNIIFYYFMCCYIAMVFAYIFRLISRLAGRRSIVFYKHENLPITVFYKINNYSPCLTCRLKLSTVQMWLRNYRLKLISTYWRLQLAEMILAHMIINYTLEVMIIFKMEWMHFIIWLFIVIIFIEYYTRTVYKTRRSLRMGVFPYTGRSYQWSHFTSYG